MRFYVYILQHRLVILFFLSVSEMGNCFMVEKHPEKRLNTPTWTSMCKNGWMSGKKYTCTFLYWRWSKETWSPTVNSSGICISSPGWKSMCISWQAVSINQTHNLPPLLLFPMNWRKHLLNALNFFYLPLLYLILGLCITLLSRDEDILNKDNIF